MHEPSPQPRPARTAALAGLLAALFYLPLVTWGLPHATGPDRTATFATDEVLPLGPLAEMHNTFVESKPDRNYAYPWWHYFTLACAQAPYLAWLKLTGGIDAPSPTYPFGLSDPVGALRVLTILGRLVSVAMAGAIVSCAFLYSQRLWGRRAGLAAATLTALNPWLVYYARTGNLDVPALFWSALGFVTFAGILQGGVTTKRVFWLGVAAGVAMATKDQALALFLPLAGVLLLPRFARTEASPPYGGVVLAGLGGSLLAFALCTGMAVDPMRQVTHVERLFFAQRTLTAAHLYYDHLEPSAASFASLAGQFTWALGLMQGPIALVASAVGVAMLLMKRPALATGALAVPTTFVLLVFAVGLLVRRYLFPLTFFLDAFAAYAFVGTGGKRPVGALLLVVAVGWRGALALDLSWAQMNDTRDGAAAWIAEHAQPGERVEYFGHAQKLPALPESLESRRVLGRGPEWEGETGHGPRVRQYLVGPEAPELLLLVPDWTSPPWLEHSQDCPPEIEAELELGTLGYRLAASFETPSLLPGGLARPHFDSPAVAPPVRIFAREDVAERVTGGDR